MNLNTSIRASETEREVVALNPCGNPPVISAKQLAPRLEALDGKTVFLVDSRFDDSIELLRQIVVWFAENMPSVKTELVSLSGYYGRDDPELWSRIRSQGDAAIIGVGHCSTCAPAVTTHAITLETLYGVPTVAVHTDKFHRVVRSVASVAGLPDAPTVYVPQPVMGRTDDELRAYVNGNDPVSGQPVMAQIITALTQMPRPSQKSNASSAAQVAKPQEPIGPATDEKIQEIFLERNWTDKLPIVVPTQERVAAMLGGTSRSPDEIVGKLQPTENRGEWEFTVEQVAVNAVMAGARPEYFPVILALASSGVSARSSSSSSGAAMVVINGPVRHKIGMNAGIGAMGPYNHANATIGRAYSLLSQNLQGGSVPGETYMGSLGNAYAYAGVTFAENEESSPWEPLHVQKGFAAEDSVASVFFGCRSTTFNLGLRAKHWQEHVANMVRGTDVVGPPTLLLDPIAARQFVERGGFETKGQLIRFIHEVGTMPAGAYWDHQLVQNYIYPNATLGVEPLATLAKAPDDELIPMFREETINVVVVGGEANGYWQIMGAGHRASVKIDDWS